MKSIGLDVEPPQDTCQDDNCPFHGKLGVRGQIIEGRVASVKGDKTIVVERARLWRLPKYDRYEKRTSRYKAHLPPCITVSPGDHIKIAECRPLSKTKSFVAVEAREGKLTVHGQDMGAPELAAPEEASEEEESTEPADPAEVSEE